MRIFLATGLIALLFVPALGAEEATEGEFLPTPFTAEQIRDAFQPGLHLVTRYTTPAGTTKTLTTVTDWTEEGVMLLDQPLDSTGHPTGEAKPIEATWKELQDHALLPRANARRSRTQRRTVLGQLEGWLYILRGEAGAQTTMFFADEYPGSPIIFTREQDGVVNFKAEQIERQVISTD